jgi:hypothetical protein
MGGEAIGQSGLYSEQSKELGDFVKGGVYLGKCRHLKKDSEPRNYLTLILPLDRGTKVCTQPANGVLKRDLIVGSSSDW